MAVRQRFVIDASPLASPRSSGVGHSVYGFIKALLADNDFTARYQIHLVAPARGMKYIRRLGLSGVAYRPVPLPARVWNRLPGTPLMPPMDLFLGRGVYFFTNFRSWPLVRSRCMTLIHDVAFRLFPDTLTPRHRGFLEHNVPRWMNRSDIVLTVSESAKRDITQEFKLDPKRVAVLYNGVDTTKFYPRPTSEITAAQQKYGLPRSYILFVGNFEPRKNLARLIRAYAALPPDLRDTYSLVLIGGSSWLDHELEQALEQAADAGAHIVRPNAYVTDADLPAVFSGARVLAWPSLHEGFGMPLLEAMATDVPALTARNSSLPEVAGEAALYVDAHDEHQIGEGLARLLADEPLRRRLIAAGRDRVAQFSWTAAARTLTGLADQLTNDPSRSTMKAQDSR